MSLVEKVLTPPAVRRNAHKAKLLWKRLFFWPLHAARKPRLSNFAGAPRSTLPIVRLRLEFDHGCGGGDSSLSVFNSIKPLTRRSRAVKGARAFAPTPMVIDLREHQGFDDWAKKVSKLTEGKYRRSANKARRLGYVTRTIGIDSYKRSLHALTASKPRRSKGVVVVASILGPPPSVIDTKAPPIPPACPRHWRVDWGAFRDTDDGERLDAYALLMRAGDVVWVQAFIGHGAALTDGVTKLLMFDVMRWLLERRDPAVEGVHYLVHGYAEEGRVGLFDWKRYFAFEPMLLEIGDAHAH